MIVKVRRPQGAWKLFDNASDPVYLDRPVPYRDVQYILEDPTLECSVIMDCKPGDDPHESLVQVVEFKRHDCRAIVIFNTVAYIMDDGGATVEKVKV